MLAGGGFNWFGHEAGATLAPGEEPEISPEHGVDALIRLAREHEGLEILLIGPVTNLALALAKEPDLVGRIAGLTIMGGHVRHATYGGHVFQPGLDYNLCSDPHASQVVLRSGIPTRLVTADVTLRTWITDKELARIDAAASPFHRVLAEEVRAWTPVQKRIFAGIGCDTDDDNVAFLHDPLALACMYDESFCRFESIEIETRIDGRVLHTIERVEASDASFPMRCAVTVDEAKIREHVTERVLGLGT
jgi:purine nucleosidase